MSLHFKIGTRGSLLATTQCKLIKEEIERLTGASFELELIKTQGDQIVDRPLWQLEGKDFFTKELDDALDQCHVDLVVHSYKDLGSDRPSNFELCTVSQRFFAHDILLIKKSTIQNLKNKQELVVGTSSPRRIVNIEKGLKDFLPNINPNLKISTKILRGNINTRVEKLQQDQYDAIVLAMAGLERLAHRPDSHATLQQLMQGLNYMIMPQSVFPSSASQGALAIEINKNSPRYHELKKILQSVHHPMTAQEVTRERQTFVSYGGGCHLAVGIFVKNISDNLFLHIERGQKDETTIAAKKLEGMDYAPVLKKSFKLMMGKEDQLVKKIPIDASLNEACNIFITSKYCLHALNENAHNIFCAGNKTWKELIKNGYWVNGSSDGLGHEEINNFKHSKLLEIFTQNKKWLVLSHDKTQSIVGDILPCYSHQLQEELNNEWVDELQKTQLFFWTSFIQYQYYVQKYPFLAKKYHATGLGKTFTQFKQNNIDVYPFIDTQHAKEVLA